MTFNIDRCLSFWSLCCLLRFTVSDYPFSILKLVLVIFHLAIVLSVLLRFTGSEYPFGIFWSLCCLFFYDLRIMITPLVSFGHCVVCSSTTYGFWLPIWYLLAIVLSVLLRFTGSDYPFGIYWLLCCLFFYDLRVLITPLVSFGHCVVVLLWYTDSDYPFGIFWPLCGCPSLIYGFWLPLWYLLAIVWLSFFDIRILITPLVSFGQSVVCPSSIYRFDYLIDIFWPLYCMSIFNLPLWLPLWYLLAIALSVHLQFTIWLPLWYLLAIVLSFLLRFSASAYPFGVF
jgi:hypothetical protein